MYTNYINYIKSINEVDLNKTTFKRNPEYTCILEHVSYDSGREYLFFIENKYKNIISCENIKEFIMMNDKIGNPLKFPYLLNNKETIECSPTSLRYIYHSLIILDYYKTTSLDSIVELGCGYGGLFLAICYFSKLLNIKINKYFMIDLPDICKLIKNYISNYKIDIEYSLSDSDKYGDDITNTNLFFISNYCFTEILDIHINLYVEKLLNKTVHGFFIWQTVFNKRLAIENASCVIKKIIVKIEEETPQTADQWNKNYFLFY